MQVLDFRAFGAGFRGAGRPRRRRASRNGRSPALANCPQGKCSPGSILRPCDTSECASTRSGSDAPAGDNILAERDDGFDLRRSDRLASPPHGQNWRSRSRSKHRSCRSRRPKLPRPACQGAARLRHELEEASILPHKIVRRHFRRRITKLPQGGLSGRQAGVMQENRVLASGRLFARRGWARDQAWRAKRCQVSIAVICRADLVAIGVITDPRTAWRRRRRPIIARRRWWRRRRGCADNRAGRRAKRTARESRADPATGGRADCRAGRAAESRATDDHVVQAYSRSPQARSTR